MGPRSKQAARKNARADRSGASRGSGPPRILLGEDHDVVRKGLRKILTDSLPRATYEEASDPGEIIRKVRQKEWDLVILGASLPGRGGIEVLKDIRKLRPALPVLVVSIYNGELFAVRALRAGASGYVPRKTTSEDIVSAVRKILAGGQFVTASLGERLAREIHLGADTIPHERLSDREFRVFLMLASGLTVKGVAERLHLSPQTVSTHRARILEKMTMETNADFVRYAFQHRLLDDCYGPAGA
jgi:DNA-binding NarL/FixJ family response regulator